jgi:hypothetical protein
MTDLVALGVQTPQINTVGNYNASRNNAIQQQAALSEQDHAALDEIGSMALGVLGGDINGQPDPQRAQHAIALLGDHNPLTAYVKQNPDAWKQVAQMVIDAKKSGGASSETWGLTPQPYKMPDGTIKLGVLSSNGNFKEVALPDGAAPAFPVQQLNTGTSFTETSKFGGATGETVPIDNAGAAHDTAVGKGSGEKEVAMPEVQATDKVALNGLESQVGIVTEDIGKAVKQIDANPDWQTGFVGDLLSAVKGTPQYDLAQTLITIKANVGFDRLQQMRDASKTGGALGSISDTETQLLQAVNGALAQGQTADQLKANLERIKTLQAKVVEEKRAAYAKKYGAGDASSAGAADPSKMSDDDLKKALGL